MHWEPCFRVASLLACLACLRAEQAPASVQSPLPCSQAESRAVDMLLRHGLRPQHEWTGGGVQEDYTKPLICRRPCDTGQVCRCVLLGGERLTDRNGRAISGAQLLRRYAESVHLPPPFWISHNTPHVSATLMLRSAENGCLITLQFNYRAKGILWLAIVPVDADPTGWRSNGVLERDYLAGIPNSAGQHTQLEVK